MLLSLRFPGCSDITCSPSICAVDETMGMLYARYGRDNLEDQMKKLFGEDMRSGHGDGELSFEEYLDAVDVRIMTPAEKKASKKAARV